MKVFLPTLAIFCCHILTGMASVITRYLVSVLDPVEIACMRYLFGGLALLPLVFIFKSDKLNRELWLKIIALGILFFALFPFLFSWSYVHTTAARGALVIATMPIWTMLISKAVGHEKVDLFSVVAVVATITGLAIALADKLFIDTGNLAVFKGEIIMLFTALTGASYAILSRSVLNIIPATTMTPIAMLAGCFFMMPFAVHSGINEHLMALNSLQFSLLVFLGIAAGGIAFFLFNWALTKSSATYTTLFVVLNPITAIFLGYLFLGEAIKVNFIVGVVIVFAGLGFAVRSQVRP